MTAYLFAIMTIAFLLFHVYFTSERRRKIIQGVSALEANEILIKFDKNYKASVLCIIGCIFTSLTCIFFNDLNDSLFPIEFLNTPICKNAGSLLIKISFILIIVVGIHVSYSIDSSFERMKLKKIQRTERISFSIVFFLCTGVFIFNPNLLSFVVVCLSLVYLILLLIKDPVERD